MTYDLDRAEKELMEWIDSLPDRDERSWRVKFPSYYREGRSFEWSPLRSLWWAFRQSR